VLTVRAATHEDVAAVARVHVRSWQVAYRGLLPDEYLDALRAEDRAARYTFGAADPSTIVATDGGVIRGFATIGAARDADGAGELFALYVDPEAWGLGIGRRLIAEARAMLAARAFTEAVLWVLAGNDRAERFYRSDGWLADGRQKKADCWGLSVDEIGYRRRL
jgi:ribosomal protein S18 acetylase RimI-like enzyme